MSSANVTSIEAIRTMRTALGTFDERARDGLTMLVLEARRGAEWIEVDRRRYWTAQVKKASEGLIEARNDLERCQLRVGSEEAPSCYEQKKRFEKAKRRLRYCEEQVRSVKRWIQAIRHEMKEFESQLAQMNNYLDIDLPRSSAALGRMIEALEKYAEQYGAVSASPAAVTEKTTESTEEGESQS